MFGENGFRQARFGPDPKKWPPPPSKWHRRRRIGKCVVWWLMIIALCGLIIHAIACEIRIATLESIADDLEVLYRSALQSEQLE